MMLPPALRWIESWLDQPTVHFPLPDTLDDLEAAVAALAPLAAAAHAELAHADPAEVIVLLKQFADRHELSLPDGCALALDAKTLAEVPRVALREAFRELWKSWRYRRLPTAGDILAIVTRELQEGRAGRLRRLTDAERKLETARMRARWDAEAAERHRRRWEAERARDRAALEKAAGLRDLVDVSDGQLCSPERHSELPLRTSDGGGGMAQESGHSVRRTERAAPIGQTPPVRGAAIQHVELPEVGLGHPDQPPADSSGRRNTCCLLPCMDGSEEFVQSLGGRFPTKSFAGPGVEGERDGRKDIGIMHAEIGSLGKVLAQQAVGVLVRAALPGAVRVTEVDLDPSGDPQMGVLCHLRALVPGQRLPQLLGQGGDRARDGVADRFGAMAGERRPVLDTRPTGVTRHRGQVEQHREPRPPGCRSPTLPSR
jgi:hypothetical protein